MPMQKYKDEVQTQTCENATWLALKQVHGCSLAPLYTVEWLATQSEVLFLLFGWSYLISSQCFPWLRC